MTLLNWWILGRYLNVLKAETPSEVIQPHVSTRTLAGWAFATVLAIVPIGAALGRAWDEIQAVLF